MSASTNDMDETTIISEDPRNILENDKTPKYNSTGVLINIILFLFWLLIMIICSQHIFSKNYFVDEKLEYYGAIALSLNFFLFHSCVLIDPNFDKEYVKESKSSLVQSLKTYWYLMAGMIIFVSFLTKYLLKSIASFSQILSSPSESFYLISLFIFVTFMLSMCYAFTNRNKNNWFSCEFLPWLPAEFEEVEEPEESFETKLNYYGLFINIFCLCFWISCLAYIHSHSKHLSNIFPELVFIQISICLLVLYHGYMIINPIQESALHVKRGGIGCRILNSWSLLYGTILFGFFLVRIKQIYNVKYDKDNILDCITVNLIGFSIMFLAGFVCAFFLAGDDAFKPWIIKKIHNNKQIVQYRIIGMINYVILLVLWLSVTILSVKILSRQDITNNSITHTSEYNGWILTSIYVRISLVLIFLSGLICFNVNLHTFCTPDYDSGKADTWIGVIYNNWILLVFSPIASLFPYFPAYFAFVDNEYLASNLKMTSICLLIISSFNISIGMTSNHSESLLKNLKPWYVTEMREEDSAVDVFVVEEDLSVARTGETEDLAVARTGEAEDLDLIASLENIKKGNLNTYLFVALAFLIMILISGIMYLFFSKMIEIFKISSGIN